MALVVVNRTPSARELRWFGAVVASFAALVGALVYWKTTMPALAGGVWIVGASVAALYYGVPALRRPLYLGWMHAAFPIGWTMSHVALIVIYYGLLTPTGVLARLAGHDPLQRRFDREAKTYWVRRRSRGDETRYFRQS